MRHIKLVGQTCWTYAVVIGALTAVTILIGCVPGVVDTGDDYFTKMKKKEGIR
ncbi:hypothetical protein [Vagococcus salmoninarum]|uniref:hypothetical protein n=1 Tax=Vagococcus salmoninarum TaxID=2739 RepID=UPI003F9B62BC